MISRFDLPSTGRPFDCPYFVEGYVYAAISKNFAFKFRRVCCSNPARGQQNTHMNPVTVLTVTSGLFS